MQFILASAKTMRERCPDMGVTAGEPRFQEKAVAMATDLARMSAAELSERFSCSPAIGEQNRQRFSRFGTDDAELMPAALAYNGQAYKHLRADLMSSHELEWADDHMWISSCLYGLLRPLDGINPYRMEGGFALPATGGLKVFEFWRPLLTELLISSVKEDDGILIYLDTEEFRTLFDWKKVISEICVIEPEFHAMKNGRLTTPSVWAKTCRGAMARFIIENRISDPEELLSFSYEGYAFDHRDGSAWHFIRK